jgi:hypothetical protein
MTTAGNGPGPSGTINLAGIFSPEPIEGNVTDDVVAARTSAPLIKTHTAPRNTFMSRAAIAVPPAVSASRKPAILSPVGQQWIKRDSGP